MITFVKCPYCNQDCEKRFSHMNIYWECRSCDASFHLQSDGGIISISWNNIFVNEQRFAAKVYPEASGNAPEFIIWFFKDPNWEEVIRWDFVPSTWTPRNINDKLKIYLPFL